MAVFKKIDLNYKYGNTFYSRVVSMLPSWGIRKYIRFIPYFNGDDVYFNLLIKNKSNRENQNEEAMPLCDWRLFRSDGKEFSLLVDNGINLPTHIYPFRNIISTERVEMSGKYKLEVKFHIGDFIIEDWKTISLFPAIDKDLSQVNLYRIIAVAIISSLLTAIATLWITGIL